MRKIVLFIVGLFAYSSISATVLTGMITDKESGEPLIGAAVYVKGTTLGGVSDAEVVMR